MLVRWAVCTFAPFFRSTQKRIRRHNAFVGTSLERFRQRQFVRTWQFLNILESAIIFDCCNEKVFATVAAFRYSLCWKSTRHVTYARDFQYWRWIFERSLSCIYNAWSFVAQILFLNIFCWILACVYIEFFEFADCKTEVEL